MTQPPCPRAAVLSSDRALRNTAPPQISLHTPQAGETQRGEGTLALKSHSLERTQAPAPEFHWLGPVSWPCLNAISFMPQTERETGLGNHQEARSQESRKTSTSASLTMQKPVTVWITTNWKILKEMRIPDHLTFLLRNLYVGQEATVRTGHATTEGFKIGKGVWKGWILSPAYAEYIMRNIGLDKSQAGIKIAARNINNLRYADNTTTPMAKSTEQIRVSWWGWKRRMKKLT